MNKKTNYYVVYIKNRKYPEIGSVCVIGSTYSTIGINDYKKIMEDACSRRDNNLLVSEIWKITEKGFNEIGGEINIFQALYTMDYKISKYKAAKRKEFLSNLLASVFKVKKLTA